MLEVSATPLHYKCISAAVIFQSDLLPHSSHILREELTNSYKFYQKTMDHVPNRQRILPYHAVINTVCK